MLDEFKSYLERLEISPNTVKSYMTTMELFFAQYDEINQENVNKFITDLTKTKKPKTVNLRINGLNKYMVFAHITGIETKGIKIPKPTFLDGIISEEDYIYFKRCLKNSGDMVSYFAVWLLATTGARVMELMQFTVEDIRRQYADIVGKGNKVRRLYIPHSLATEALEWLASKNITSGPFLLNRYGDQISIRGLAQKLKNHAETYGLDKSLVHPHAFRHLFAKSFLAHNGDLVMLADLMGHSSIETTRIYLRHTSMEQRRVINSIVDW